MFDNTLGAMQTGFYYVDAQHKTVYYASNGQMQYGSQTIDGTKYTFNNVTGALISGNAFLEKVFNWYNNHRGKLTYSMYGSRNGSDGTADCSGAMTAALWSAGAGTPSASARRYGGYNTVSIRPYLTSNGFKMISSNTNIYVKRGDIIVLGNTAGDNGHIGIVSNGGYLTNALKSAKFLSVSGHNKNANGGYLYDGAVTDMSFYDECHGMSFHVYRKA